MIEFVSVRPTIELICAHAANITQIPVESIRSRKRNVPITKARILVAYVARAFKYTLTEIGKYLNRDHTTIVYELKVYKTLTEIYDYFGDVYDRLMNALEIKKEAVNLFNFGK